MTPMKHLRAIGAALLLIGLLAGPTPGAVGSCDQETKYADPAEFCEDRENLACQRARVRCLSAGGTDCVAMEQACIGRVPEMCAGYNFAVGCQPTERQTQNCIDQLSRIDTVHIEEVNDVPGCTPADLCGSDTMSLVSGAPDGGVEAP